MRKLAASLALGLLVGTAGSAAGAPPTLPPFDQTMTLKQVGPHVVRVLDDGAGHDFTDPNTFEDLKPVSLLAAGDDGSVWMTSSGGFIRIGTPGEVYDPLGTWLAQMEIGPDGALWIADVYQGTSSPRHRAAGKIGRWHDGKWTIHQLPSDGWVVWLEAREDDGLDFAWRDETTLYFGQLEPGAEARTPAPLPPLPLVSADGYIEVERAPNGQLWVAEGPWWYESQRSEPGPLWTFDGSAWRSVQPLGDLPVRPMSLVVEPAGTLRVGWQEIAPGMWKPGATWYTTRLGEDGDWSVVDVVEDEATKRRGWCRGYAHIEGERLTRYLDGKCLRPVAITPTGEVWAFGTNRNRKRYGIYIITPDR
jgi:hypothetical protein